LIPLSLPNILSYKEGFLMFKSFLPTAGFRLSCLWEAEQDGLGVEDNVGGGEKETNSACAASSDVDDSKSSERRSMLK
jgi:hypothetical protein